MRGGSSEALRSRFPAKRYRFVGEAREPVLSRNGEIYERRAHHRTQSGRIAGSYETDTAKNGKDSLSSQLKGTKGPSRMMSARVFGRGGLMSDERIVIPEVLRAKVLRELHAGHPGVTRMKRLARSFVYWPRIDAEIEKAARNCSACA